MLKDILSHGDDASKLFTAKEYNLEMAKTMEACGRDCFTDKDIVTAIPAVSLRHATNRNIISKKLVDIFMNGKNLTMEAWFLYLAANDAMMKKTKSPNTSIYQYNIDQILNNVMTTVDFSNKGEKMSLINAMKTYCTQKSLERIDKSFTTICLMIRMLTMRQMVDIDVLENWLRQSLIKEIVYVRCNNDKSLFSTAVKMLCYEIKKQSIVKGSGHVTNLKEFLGWMSLMKYMPSVEDNLKHAERVLGKESVLSETQLTAILLILSEIENSKKDGLKFLTDLIDTNPIFSKIWNNEEINVVELLNAKS
jgi:hypothetical protein